jgi:Calcineurin-like phosphoesterase
MSSNSGARRTIVIGDVHGCLDELRDLLRACAVDRRVDRVILVGDLVAKGPDSRGVVQLAREHHLRAVLGNHDAKVLSFDPEISGVDPENGAKNHAAVARTLGPDDWSYLRNLPLYLALPDLETVVVHAGLLAGVALSEQPRDMLLNMRSITAGGDPSKRVDAGTAWASLWPGPTHVIFGHDATRGLQKYRFATGLDTGCVYGRSLTAVILPERRFVSVPARRAYAAM